MYPNPTAQDFDQWVALSDRYAMLQRLQIGDSGSRRDELAKLAHDLKQFEFGIGGRSQLVNTQSH